ncbi:MAG: hypothetical protein ACK4F8_00965 [Aquabacterium sp.]
MLERTHTFRICLAALLSTAMSSAAATSVYRCEGAGSAVRYQQHPCTDQPSASPLAIQDRRTREQTQQARRDWMSAEAQGARMERERLRQEKRDLRQHRYAGALTIASAKERPTAESKRTQTNRGKGALHTGVPFEAKERDFRAVYRPNRPSRTGADRLVASGQH